MEKWENIASELFKKEFEEFKKTRGDSRRPDEVKFSTIDKDVLRRDLTINNDFELLERVKIGTGHLESKR